MLFPTHYLRELLRAVPRKKVVYVREGYVFLWDPPYVLLWAPLGVTEKEIRASVSKLLGYRGDLEHLTPQCLRFECSIKLP